jgi:predicted dehydrogenase
MVVHPPISSLFVVDEKGSSLEPFISYVESLPHVRVTVEPRLPQELHPYDVIVTANTTMLEDQTDGLAQFVRKGGGWLGLVDLSDKPLPQLFGAQPNPIGPSAEVRVLFERQDHPVTARLTNAMYVSGYYQSLNPTGEDAETILYADWHYEHQPVLVGRPFEGGHVACTTLQAYDNPVVQQILYRLLRQLAAVPTGKETLGVGLLGYAVSVGELHGMGIDATPGLTLRAVCDLNPQRLEQAQKDFAYAKVYASTGELARDPDVDVVIVATSPNTHAELCLQMMAAGKHVVCEKPLALNQKETAALIEMAEKEKVHLSCHQNRRFDVDYLAIRRAVTEGLIGDLFYMETFVGSFNHPCGYWHSHVPISGGAAYDWGGHYVDWVVSLLPERVDSVVATRQKRVWHDITNADQERILIRFAGGQEAEFMHSDIAAIRKPKWYLLGTEGAIVGHWRDVATYEIDPVLYFHRHDIPPTEMPPDLTLQRRHRSGDVVVQKLGMPRREDYLFHRNLADHLLTGEPIAAPLKDSVTVVAVLEAAARSAAKGGTVEVLRG